VTRDETAIGRDLERCDLGIALTRGRLRQRYLRHRAACYRALADMNKADFARPLTDDEILAALTKE
jgi:hypothetical protein